MRKNYNYVLDNPYEFPGFYLKYSRPQYADFAATALLTWHVASWRVSSYLIMVWRVSSCVGL